MKCNDCIASATGTFWIGYHAKYANGQTAVHTAHPSCERCAGEWESAWAGRPRPMGFIPGIITKDIETVENALSNVDILQAPGTAPEGETKQ